MKIKKTEVKRGRGRPRKEPDVKKKTDLAEPVIKSEESPKGIITEDELLDKVQSVRQTGESLPEEHQTEIEPGIKLEDNLLNAENAEEIKPSATTDTPGVPVEGDAIAEMENAMILVPLEQEMNLPKDFLRLNEQDQKLLSMVRPDDLGVTKSPEWYWSIFGLLNVSKFTKWFFYNRRMKKEAAKKKAKEESLKVQEFKSLEVEK